MLALNEKLPALNLYDDDTVKWEHEGKRYCLHIRRDETPPNPRRDWDNITTMACWHRRYNLGDEIPDKEPEDFWRRLVRENVSGEEVFKAAKAGKLAGIRLATRKGLIDIYETSYIEAALGKGDPKEYLEYEGIEKGCVADYLMDDLTIKHCMTLLGPYAEWLPLWLYDHSGITMSCGSRVGQYADRWDSGCVGWIVALKKTIMEETVDYVLDENGEKIWVEHKRDGYPSTWSPLTKKLTNKTWRARAIEVMKSDVEIYDLYLTGEVYGYTVHEWDDDGDSWNEGDSCWEFFGSNIVESGICDEVGCGLRDAIREKRYETGKAELQTVSYYTF